MSAQQEIVEVPEGFEPLFRTSPFLDCTGPYFYKKTGDSFVVGLRVLAKHTNVRGTLHGGLISTLADISLGYVTAFSSEPRLHMATASMSIDFAGSAKLGDWVESHVTVIRRGSRLAFASALIQTNDKPIARASAVFAVQADDEVRGG
jgi:acyl-coenzyme A thioesterase 13